MLCTATKVILSTRRSCPVPVCKTSTQTFFDFGIALSQFNPTSKKCFIGWKYFVLRFTRNCRLKPEDSRCGLLEVPDLEEALRVGIRLAQQHAFPAEFHALRMNRPFPRQSLLANGTPFLDRYSVMRVSGRFSKGPLSDDFKHPTILPNNHRVTHLIILDIHVAKSHGSTEPTLGELRSCYWVPRPRQAIKRVLKNCRFCRRYRCRPQPTLMGALQYERLVHLQRPFFWVGITFGPCVVVKPADYLSGEWIPLSRVPWISFERIAQAACFGKDGRLEVSMVCSTPWRGCVVVFGEWNVFGI